MKTETQETHAKRVKDFFILLGLLASILFLASCNEEDRPDLPISPTAEFEVDAAVILQNEPVTFTNLSEDGESFLWSFGDGNSSEEIEPTHTYTDAGDFTVTLTVTNDEEVSESALDIYVESTEVPSGLYLEEVYTEVSQQTFMYGSFDENEVTFFEAEGYYHQEVTNRPLILLSPGGAFAKYSYLEELSTLCENLAKRGYAVGMVKYALGPQDLSIWMKAFHDQKAAIRYFKLNAADYRIDPNNIFIGGWSTGAQIALMNGLLQEDEIDLIENSIIRNGIQDLVDQNTFEGTQNAGVDSNVKGVIMMFGFMFELNVIDENDVPIMLINHELSTLSDGATLIKDEFVVNGIRNYGPDAISEKAISVGYENGKTLEYINMDGPKEWDYYSLAAMDPVNFDAIAQFVHQNL